MFLLRCLEHENFSINGNYPDLLLKVVISQKRYWGQGKEQVHVIILLLGSAANLVILNLIMILKMLSPSASSFVADDFTALGNHTLSLQMCPAIDRNWGQTPNSHLFYSLYNLICRYEKTLIPLGPECDAPLYFFICAPLGRLFNGAETQFFH